MEGFDVAEIIPGRYYLAAHGGGPATGRNGLGLEPGCLAYCIDHELIYEPFYADFGPLNLGRTFRFCEKTARLLNEVEQDGQKLFLLCGPEGEQRANAAVLVGAFQLLLLGRGADEAYALLAHLGPFTPFRDASCGPPCFQLAVQDCLRGLERAVMSGLLDVRPGAWRFDVDEYEHYEQVENGDLTWVVPGKLAAFSGPAATPNAYVGFRAMVPEDYVPYFQRRRVTAVVRLNKKVYDRRRFLDGGLRHHELYFPDGSCPGSELLLTFLDIAEQEPGALAIHCKAGLGRTGVLICAYLMKHYRFTAEEAIGYIRIARPGSVIGPQQCYLQEIEQAMWREGDAWRAAHGAAAPVAPPPPLWGPSAPGRAASMRRVAVCDALLAASAACGSKGAGGGFEGDSVGGSALDKARLALASHPVGSFVTDATSEPTGAHSSGSSYAGDDAAAAAAAAPAAQAPAQAQACPAGGGALQGLFGALGFGGGGGGGSSGSGPAAALPMESGEYGTGVPLCAWRPPQQLQQPSLTSGPAGRPQGNVVYTLAPNGQPRKVPASMLQAAADAPAARGASPKSPGALASPAAAAAAPAVPAAKRGGR